MTHALREGGGRTCFIAEDEIMAMQLRLASTEGVTWRPRRSWDLCALEPLGLPQDAFVVAVGTSSGLKDPATSLDHLPAIARAEPGQALRLLTLVPVP